MTDDVTPGPVCVWRNCGRPALPDQPYCSVHADPVSVAAWQRYLAEESRARADAKAARALAAKRGNRRATRRRVAEASRKRNR